MGFLDLFKPKWKHSDADVRAEAVKQFSPADAAILAQVVRLDRDVRVRRIAMKKIDDAQLLFELAESDPDEGLRRDAAEKAQALLISVAIGDGDESHAVAALEKIATPRGRAEVAKRAHHEVVRRSAIARMQDPKAIADVAKKSDDPHIRRQAVEKITDIAVLREVAVTDAVKEVALAAVERIDDAQALEVIAKKSKSKAVKTAAREKLATQKDAAPKGPGGLTEAKRRSRQALICRTVEEAAASDDWQHASAAIEVARASWAELGQAPGDDPFQKRFDRAVAKFNLRKEEVAQKQRVLAAREAAKEVERKQVAEPKVKTADELAVDEARAAEDRKLREVADAARQEEQERRSAERARRAEEKAKKEAESAESRARKDAELEENLKRYEEVCARLESLAETNDKKAADSALKSANDVVQSAGLLPRDKMVTAKARYQAAREKLVIKAQELRDAEDWKRWSNVPRLEALCAKMDALLTAVGGPREVPAAVPTADSAVAATPAAIPVATPAATPAATIDLKQALVELKALQAEWKTVGAAPKDKSESLWKRFKATSDQVYERCKQSPAGGGDESREANLKKKDELCVKVEALVAVPDDQMQWKDTAETIKAAQEEWKAIGPVPKEQSDAIWKRFRGACDQFFDRRKAQFAEADQARGENQKKLEALCDKVEALAQSTEWKETAELIKGYQADWKEVGPAPKEHSEALWKRFREACDQFFDRRKAHFAELDEERGGNLKQKEHLCEKAEALAAADDHAAALVECRKLQSEWKTIGPAPKDVSDAVWNRFRSACDVLFDRTRAPAEAEPAPAVPAAAPAEPFKFTGFAEKLQAATSEWEVLAEESPTTPAVTKKAEKPEKKSP